MPNLNDFLGFDPISEMSSYRDAARQLFEAGWPTPRDINPSALASVVVPVDVLDTGPEIVVLINLPGVKAEDISISVISNNLTVKGTLQVQPELEGATYLRHERRATAFTRTLSLSYPVDSDRAEAKLNNGVLTLTLPKSESLRPKTIRVAKD
jgi:HSP20 family protein